MGPAAPSQHRTSPPDREEGLEFLIFFHRKEVHKSSGLSDTERGRGEEQEKKNRPRSFGILGRAAWNWKIY